MTHREVESKKRKNKYVVLAFVFIKFKWLKGTAIGVHDLIYTDDTQTYQSPIKCV